MRGACALDNQLAKLNIQTELSCSRWRFLLSFNCQAASASHCTEEFRLLSSVAFNLMIAPQLIQFCSVLPTQLLLAPL